MKNFGDSCIKYPISPSLPGYNWNHVTAGPVLTTTIPTEESDLMKITPLGAGQEVGRSCHIVEFKVGFVIGDIRR